MESPSLPVHISKQTVQNLKYFVYQNKKYPINFDLLKNNCNYFYIQRRQYKNIDNISLINEDEESIFLTEESIKAFITICQNESSEITLSTAIPLQYLSYKFDFPALKSITDEFITKYSKELLFQKLLFNQNNEQKDEPFFDTRNEEQYLSKHLNEYINKEEMLLLKVPVLERVLQQYFRDEENEQKVSKKDMNDFLFKCLDQHGQEASILFNNIDFGEENVDVVYCLLHDYQDKFNFNFLNSTLAKTTLQVTNDFVKQKEEYSMAFSEMKKTFDEMRNELQQMREEEKRKEMERERKEIELKEGYAKEIEKIKKENEKQIQDIQDKFAQMCSQQEELIQNSVIQKYHKTVLEMMDVDAFYKLSDESKNHIINEIINGKMKFETNQQKEKNDHHSIIQNISCLNRIFKILSANDSGKNIKQMFSDDRSSFMKFIIDNLKHFKISNDVCEHLCKKELLQKSLLDIIENFDEFTVEIVYSTESFQQISKIIHDIAKKNKNYSNQMKVSVSIDRDDYFERKPEINGIINTLDVQKPVTKMCEGAFEDCSLLTEITIQSSIKTIESKLFSGCSSLTEITIPSSVTSIGSCSFAGCKSLVKINIPSSVQSIGEHAFAGCSSLSEIEIPSSITAIGEYAFRSCSSLTHIEIPSSLERIESSTFFLCSSLSKVKIPSSVKQIDMWAFASCSSLTQITIPPFVTSIGSSAFKDCSSLPQITIPFSVTKIEGKAFSGCSSLTHVTIPSSVTKIGDDAFSRCSSLIQIEVLSSLNIKNIGIKSNVKVIQT